MSQETELDSSVASHLSGSAERMRRYRRRRAKGMRCLTIEIRQTELAALVAKGLLSANDQADRNAVRRALYVFLDRTLRIQRYV